ncbi:MAG: zinc-binding dehydrogenase [Thaumarchaeota archaeon]|nr:zinc-binding dehydrogenase [Nitrososphaerota archaeon]MCL5316876.1 zinc-binding dehydrogenase [Nitrososphaerota archaeon]
MKAVVFHEYGGVDKLRYEDAPDPAPHPGEVLVRVKAVALNHLDIWERLSGSPLPHISGSDISGEIAQLGDWVTGLKKGEKVVVFPSTRCGRCEACLLGHPTQCAHRQIIGNQTNGGYAEYVTVPAENIFPLPENLSFEEAAALPLAGSTAWHMLVSKGHVDATSTVLIHGAGSGVSVYAVQLGKIFGAKVIVTTSTEEKAEKARELGADHVINYRKENVVEAVKRLTNERGVDVVVDHVGATTFNDSLRALRVGGKLVSAGVTTGKKIEFDISFLYRNELIIEGSYIYTIGEFYQVLKMARDGRLKPVVSQIFPLSKAAEAQRAMEEGRQFGKLILKV